MSALRSESGRDHVGTKVPLRAKSCHEQLAGPRRFSNGQTQLFAQTLVEHLGGREPTQQADLPSDLAGGIAPLRAAVGCGPEHHVSH